MVAKCVDAAPSKQVAYAARSTNDALRDMLRLSPNELKLSDGGKKDKELGTDATPPFAGARG